MNELSLLDSLFGTDGCGYADGYVPSVDVQETKDAYVLTMDLPGMNEKDIAIDLDGLKLTIMSQKDLSKDESQYLLHERTSGNFKREFELPEDINGEAVRASCANGVLTVTVPRKTIAASAKKITIEAA